MDTQKHDPKTERKPLKQALFDRIEEEQVVPRSRLIFRGQECFIWFLWLLSVIVGSFAVAISLFVVLHRQYSLYEATHDNFFTYLVDVLPYIWIIVFGLMVAGAVFNLRHTRHGYRYPVWGLVASSLVLSFAGGSAMQFFGLGYTVDDVLGRQMGMYMSQEKLEYKLWQQPEDGRLIGRQTHTTVAPEATVIFTDANGAVWNLDVTELVQDDRNLLAKAGQVRVLGQVMDADFKRFHACGVFPWMMNKQVTMNDMNRERQAFVEKVYEQKHRAEDRVQLLEQEAYATSSQPWAGTLTISVCADIAAVRRVSSGMAQ